MFQDRKEVAYRYDGVYSGHKFLAQSEVRFDESDRISYIEYTVINGFESHPGVVGRGERSAHGANPTREALNKQVVIRRIAVLNGRNHDEAVRFVNECYAPEFVACVKAVWVRSREGMVKAFDDAFAARSMILDPQILEAAVTTERVEYSYRGQYNGATFSAFCCTSFTPEGKILSENWRVVT
jgi:hypothetical protein